MPVQNSPRPHRLVAQDKRFSAVEQGFDSPWGYTKPLFLQGFFNGLKQLFPSLFP